VATVAEFCGRELVLDEAMEERIAAILRKMIGDRPGVDFDAVRAANRKQAMVPVGAEVLAPVGTAPGVVVGSGGPTVVVLPGPPRELQPMWHTAVATEAVQQAISGRTKYRQEMVRMFGLAESGLAETLREAEGS
nr:molybdopterin-binding protein [Streptomyces sp. DSM 41633]